MNEFLKKIKLKRIEEREFEGKKTRYVVFEQLAEERIKISDECLDNMEEGKTYLMKIKSKTFNGKAFYSVEGLEK